MTEPTDSSPAAAAALPQARRDTLLLVLLAIIWGSAFPIIRFGLLAGASPFLFGAARFAGAAALMAVIARARRAPWPPVRTIAIGAAFGGVLTIGGYAAFLYSGEETVSGGLAAVLVGTVPLWTALFSSAALPQERLGARASAGIALGFGGLLVLFAPELLAGRAPSFLGEALVVGAALSASLGAVSLHRLLPRGIDMWNLTVQFVSAAGLLGLLGLILPGGSAFAFNERTLGSVAYLAVVPSVVGYTIFFGLIDRGGATRASLVAYLNPLAGILVGVAVFGEGATVTEVAGFLLIVLGLYLFQSPRVRTDAPSARSRSSGQ